MEKKEFIKKWKKIKGADKKAIIQVELTNGCRIWCTEYEPSEINSGQTKEFGKKLGWDRLVWLYVEEVGFGPMIELPYTAIKEINCSGANRFIK